MLMRNCDQCAVLRKHEGGAPEGGPPHGPQTGGPQKGPVGPPGPAPGSEGQCDSEEGQGKGPQDPPLPRRLTPTLRVDSPTSQTPFSRSINNPKSLTSPTKPRPSLCYSPPSNCSPLVREKESCSRKSRIYFWFLFSPISLAELANQLRTPKLLICYQ